MIAPGQEVPLAKRFRRARSDRRRAAVQQTGRLMAYFGSNATRTPLSRGSDLWNTRSRGPRCRAAFGRLPLPGSGVRRTRAAGLCEALDEAWNIVLVAKRVEAWIRPSRLDRDEAWILPGPLDFLGLVDHLSE